MFSTESMKRVQNGSDHNFVIGIDFDNTIIDYGNLFYDAGVSLGIVQPLEKLKKQDIRHYLIRIGKEQEWTRIQGLVYGNYIRRATVMPGFLEFLGFCSKKKLKVLIISHKTRESKVGHKYDLHVSAQNWLEKNLFGKTVNGSIINGVFFETSREKKIQRVCQAGCNILIDDLPKVLLHPNLPKDMKKILFDPHGFSEPSGEYLIASSWSQIQEIIEGLYA